MTNWKPEDINEARQRAYAADQEQRGMSDAAVSAIMACAVELAAARGGTMTARDRQELREALSNGTDIPHVRECLAAALDDLDAQGATAATLQAKVEGLEKELERYRNPRCQREECARERTRVDVLEPKVEEETERANSMHRTWQRAEQENTALRAEVERLKAELEREAEDSLRVIGEYAERIRVAESRLAAIREAGTHALTVLENIQALRESANEPFGAVPRVASRLRTALDGDAPNPSMPSNGSDATRLAVIREKVGHQLTMVRRALAAEKMAKRPSSARIAEWSLVEVTLEPLAKSLEEDTPACTCSAAPAACVASEHPCSSTCIHPDRLSAGHRQRIGGLSAALVAGPNGAVLTQKPVPYEDSSAQIYNAGWRDAVAAVEERVRKALENASAEVLAAVEGATP